MATYNNEGDSIECNQSQIAVRKISNNPFITWFDEINGNLFKYKSSKRSIATIIEELERDRSKEQIVPKICETSKVNLNDKLECDIMEIYTQRRIETSLLSNFSHVHGIQAANIKCFTYAKIIMPFRYVLEQNPLQKKLDNGE